MDDRNHCLDFPEVDSAMEVNDDDVMVLVDELDQEEASLLEQEKTESLIAYKLHLAMNNSVGCQTDFETFVCSSIPVLFCGLISPDCDATTQCDIPKVMNVSVQTYGLNSPPRETLKSLPRVISLNKTNKVEEEDRIKISVPMLKNGRGTSVQSNIGQLSSKAGETENYRVSGTPLGTLTVSINKGTNVVTIGKKDEAPKPTVDMNCINKNQGAITTFKAEPLSPPSKKMKSENNAAAEEDNDSESLSFSDNEDEDVIEEVDDDDDDGDDIDDWDVPLKEDERTENENVTQNEEVDEQLIAVEECLRHIKSEPLDDTEDISPIKIPKKVRLNLLHSVFHNNIKIEADQEWITDDEIDDEVDETDISQHLEQVMKDNDNRTCKECNITFNSPLILIEHSEANHIANICHICGFTTTYQNKLDRHMVKHTKEKSFICDMCGKQYSQKQNLRDHISRNHSEEDASSRYPFSCEHCKRMYRNESNLLKHQERKGGQCEICGQQLACMGMVFQHKKNHISCKCEYCDKVFQSRSALQIHVNIKHKDKGLQCSMCPKKFLFPSYLKLHFANAHSQSSPKFKCQECGFCAVTESYLKSHMTRMHSNTNKKKYVCQVCNKHFRSNARLVEHTRIHTGERPFACPVCYKTFYSQSNLYSHERTVHGRLNNYGSKDPSHTQKSNSTSVMKKIFSSCYQCQHCSSTFNNKKKLKAHMASVHNIPDDDNKDEESNGITNNLNDLEVDDVPFEIDNETVLHAGNAKDVETLENNALSLPAYVVPPNVNLVEIDGVQYHVIRSNT
ncbi:hypothetical protein SK128_024478 [Halocaridina rubra]|uniref:C2H2-type domain-containing protein n=1 Tax=Halocaridina rubra TaxID=373956 RepID=A0AAN8XDH6_HALRR